MLIWLILLTDCVLAGQTDMRKINLQVLSNSYFNTTSTSSIVVQKMIPKTNSIFAGCAQLCLSMSVSCSTAVYNNKSQICTIYSTTMGTQQTSSCCTTFVNNDIDNSVKLPVNPQVTNTGNLFTGRRCHTATLLSSGQVLVTGGRNFSTVFTSCELYSPGSGTWTIIASMNVARALHTATIVTTNNIDLVFVIGGFYLTAHNPVSSIEYYNSSSGVWTMIGNSMATARFAHSTTVLKDGRFLVAGGSDISMALASSEIFNPTTLTWQTVSSLNAVRMQHMDAILDNGNVFVAGGLGTSVGLQSCEIFDITLQTWSLVPNMANQRNLASLVSLLSISNSLFMTGGLGNPNTAYSSSDLYYPSTNTMVPSADMTFQRFSHTTHLIYYQSTPLVVTIGGLNSLYNAINTVQLYIVANATWVNIAGLITARGTHTSTVFKTSPPSILVVGGQVSLSAMPVLNSVEILTF